MDRDEARPAAERARRSITPRRQPRRPRVEEERLIVGKVVVVGSLNMDVVATAPRHPAIGETVLGTGLRFVPGGKGANQAVAAARLGATTVLIGKVGGDAFATSLLEFLASQGVGLGGVTRSPDEPTGTALIVIGERSDNTIVVVPGANATLATGDLDGVELQPGDVVVAQYEIPLPVVQAALTRAKAAGASTILNPAPALATPDEVLPLADVIVLNETELGVLTGAGLASSAADAGRLSRVLRRRGGQAIIATLGADGAVALIGEEIVRIAGRPVPVVDSTGAGDCFVGAMAAALCSGTEIGEAARFANVAASLSVQQFGAGTSMPSLADVDAAGGVSPGDA
jgi:ribokinase